MKRWSKNEESTLLKMINKDLSNETISRKISRSTDSIDSKLKRLKKRKRIKRRKLPPDTKNYEFDIKNISDIIGLTLYWCEGSKINNRIVEFVNSDPKTIQIFMKFLRTKDISEDRLRARVKLYNYQDISEYQDYWSKISGIPVSQFQKPIIRKGKPKRNYKSKHNGTFTIRYNSKKLYDTLQNSIDEVKKLL